MKNTIKSTKGITLIALIIIITVLLIIQGVTIVILTANSTDANSTSAYYKAEEQVKNACEQVKTQISTEKSINSSYNASSTLNPDNVTALADIARKELKASAEKVTEGFEVVANKTANPPTIDITYKNSKICEGTIDSNKPKHSGYVTYKIILYTRNVELEVDGNLGSSNSETDTVDPEANSTPAGEATAEIGAVNTTYVSSFGKLVTGYNPSQKTNWRLFYADSTNAYLISDSIGKYRLDDLLGWRGDTLTSSNVSTLGRNLNSKFTAWETNPNHDNKKGVAVLTDSTKWTNYKTSDAKWAVGAPPIEMFVASYNATHTIQLDSIVDEKGYKVSKNGGEYDTCQTDLRESGKESLDDAIYCPESGHWWLCSPSSASSGRVAIIRSYYDGSMDYSYFDNNRDIRPLVAVPITKIGNGITITDKY